MVLLEILFDLLAEALVAFELVEVNNLLLI
jgi:hypothetical protein